MCSSRPRARAGSALAGAWILTALLAGPLHAQARLTQGEALQLAFPGAEVERRTAFLDDAALEAARALAGAGVTVSSRVVTYYVGRRDGAPLGVAYFDGHVVRTLAEVLMIVVSPADRIERIEVLRFDEPPEYRVPDDWIAQLQQLPLDERLSLKGDVVNMTGATLTSEAVVAAARRVLALHAVIRPLDAGSD
jgi:hypothetical protein